MSITIPQLNYFLQQHHHVLSSSYHQSQCQIAGDVPPNASHLMAWPLVRCLHEFYGRLLGNEPEQDFHHSPPPQQYHHSQYEMQQTGMVILRPEIVNSSNTPLLSLSGTIPVSIHSQTYNIPIGLILPKYFPSDAPHVQIQPTSDMSIRNDLTWLDEHTAYLRVAATGGTSTTYAYLTAWKSNRGIPNWQYPRFDLGALVADLQRLFARECPVFAKLDQRAHHHHHQHPQPRRPSPPKHMTQSMPSSQIFNPYASQHQQQHSWAHQSWHGAGGSSSALNHSAFGQFAQFTNQSTNPMVQSQQQNSQQMALQNARSQIMNKLMRKLRAFKEEQQQLIQTHFNTQQQLKNSQETQKLQESSIENDQKKTDQVLECLQKELPQFKGWIDKESNASYDVDQVVVLNSAMSQQLMETEAKDLALTDLMYHLDSALHRGQIHSTSDYLTQIRRLGREQFQYRALSEKIISIQGPGR
eukprot:CAMPEP_0117440624 /NCGR_PEP_ID=MMETSP0759-20121206/3194_1 /TAXON_ID=63605 /ORGANISM="Percolomonas cosmopolitus, Strain WS" /LENGTH=469 /DNA_ID=CAMNT_0005232411 /DNA_START=14 /DNA_END=1423 /DNA_ORIENTATION=-